MQNFLTWLESWDDEDDGEVPEIDGEYWITGGDVVDCGEDADTNHEGYVMQHLQDQIANKVGHGLNSDWDTVKRSIAEVVYREKRQHLVELKEEAEAEEDHPDRIDQIQREIDDLDFKWRNEDHYEFMYEGLERYGITEDEMRAADDQGDAREYAIKVLGWKRVEGSHIETWTLNHEDIRDIVSGVEEIFHHEENVGKVEVYIYCYGNKTSHDVTIDELEQILVPKPMQTPAKQPEPPQEFAFGKPIPPPAEPEQPQNQLQRINRDRGHADIDLQQKASINHGRDQDLQMMHPYYRNKKFPFADWVFRNYAKVL